MLNSRLKAGGACAILLCTSLLVTGTAAAQGVEGAISLSEKDCELLTSYQAVFSEAGVAAASRAEILRQLRAHPPLALVEGYWVSPIDLRRLLIVAADLERSPGNRAGEPGARPAAGPPGRYDLVALAFVGNVARTRIPLPYVGEFDPAGAMTATEIVIVPLKDADEVLVEYLPPPVEAETSESECYYFCGDPEEWDFDGDGTPNAMDSDDDGDGVPNDRDAYPYWPGSSVCECGDRSFVGFMGKFSNQLTGLILAGFEQLGQGRSTPMNQDQDADHLRFEFVIPRSSCPSEACIRLRNPEVSYVSEDPEECALIRYRCETGEVPFSDDCGCGCRKAVR